LRVISCPGCAHTIRLPIHVVGKTIRCGTCQIEIKTSAPADEPTDGILRFSCSGCGRTLRSTADKAGMRSRCPGCSTPVTAPSLTTTIAFRCPGCQEYYVRKSKGGGRPFACTYCDHGHDTGSVDELDVVEDLDEVELLDEHSSRAPPGGGPIAPILYKCPACGTLDERPSDYAGMAVDCLSCKAKIRVPSAPNSHTSGVPVEARLIKR
jgi:DNA-directed RNA polymerase subunit RPC12/RpoP